MEYFQEEFCNHYCLLGNCVFFTKRTRYNNWVRLLAYKFCRHHVRILFTDMGTGLHNPWVVQTHIRAVRINKTKLCAYQRLPFKLVAIILIVFLFIAILLLIINGVITLFISEESKSMAYVLKIAGIIWLAISFPTVQVMIMTTYKRLVYSHQDVDDDIAETN
jgi:hypothetical protein